jgi:hypothetical protein
MTRMTMPSGLEFLNFTTEMSICDFSRVNSMLATLKQYSDKISRYTGSLLVGRVAPVTNFARRHFESVPCRNCKPLPCRNEREGSLVVACCTQTLESSLS